MIHKSIILAALLFSNLSLAAKVNRTDEDYFDKFFANNTCTQNDQNQYPHNPQQQDYYSTQNPYSNQFAQNNSSWAYQGYRPPNSEYLSYYQSHYNQPYSQAQYFQSYSQAHYYQPYSQENQLSQVESYNSNQNKYFQDSRSVNANKQMEAEDWAERMKVQSENSPYQGVYPQNYNAHY